MESSKAMEENMKRDELARRGLLEGCAWLPMISDEES